jgi:hypothetical protein
MRIIMSSSAFAPSLDFTSLNAVFNDGATAGSTTWGFILAPGTYLFGATSVAAGATGSYTLDASSTFSTFACNAVFVTKGITFSTANLNSSDCAYTITSTLNSPPAGTRNGDRFVVRLAAGQSLRVRASGTGFDPYIELRRGASSNFLSDPVDAVDDDGGGGTDALINFTATTAGYYSIWVTSWEVSGSGSYTLTIDP